MLSKSENKISNKKRTPLKDRILPNYTNGEELSNSITHMIGVLMGAAVLALGIVIAAKKGSGLSLAGAIVYGVSMILLYTVSTLYHGLKHPVAKRVMQVIDHCTIYMLIIGTYLPILIAGVLPHDPRAAWIGLIGEMIFAAVGVTFSAIDHNKYNKLSMACYIGMGWMVLCILPQTIAAITVKGFIWLLAGGVVYTLGAVIYAIGKKKSVLHTVFHVLTLIGSGLQAVCILCYVL